MSAPQISTATLVTSIDQIIEAARDDMRDLAEIAKGRKLTDDELAEYASLARTINYQTLQRDSRTAAA